MQIPDPVTAINRNMGCIEIRFVFQVQPHSPQINRNMGCIEMYTNQELKELIFKINRNMGCIEMNKEVWGYARLY